jgi:hypothetical protein
MVAPDEDYRNRAGRKKWFFTAQFTSRYKAAEDTNFLIARREPRYSSYSLYPVFCKKFAASGDKILRRGFPGTGFRGAGQLPQPALMVHASPARGFDVLVTTRDIKRRHFSEAQSGHRHLEPSASRHSTSKTVPHSSHLNS